MKKLLGIIVILLSSCGIYQSTPVDKCCETDVVYLDELQDGTTVFTNYDNTTIRLELKPLRPNFYSGFNINYGYWNTRPLWLDYGFYNNYYSYFNSPWNYWDWYMKPWTASNSWYEGPFNNQGYNVAYNSSRRNSIQDQLEQDTNKINRKPVTTKTIIYKPLNNNNRPSYNFIPNNKPVINNSKPVINNSKPSFNRPPRINNNSKPTRNNTKPNVRTIKNNR
tara:strand:- start:767 stop:1432 length:666 start_codon:yes stop_codon:yes gene_type:complete